MGVKGGRPSDEGRVRTWTHVSVAKGKTFEGWIAGDAICVFAHCGDDPSTPCLRHYLGKRAQCKRCTDRHRTEWLYYVPLWREWDGGKPVLVIVHEEMRDVLERIKVGAYVTVGREDGKKTAVYIRPMLNGRRFETAFEWKKRGQCIADALVTLFRMRGTLSGELLLAGGIEQGTRPNTDAKGNPRLSPEETVERSVEVLRDRFPVAEEMIPDTVSRITDELKSRSEAFASKHRNGKSGKADG